MKQLLLSFCIILSPTLVLSQEWKTYDFEQWKDFKVDEDVTVQVSSEVFTQDLQGGKVYSCIIPNGAYIFSVSLPSENFQASNKEDLNKIYSEIIDGYLEGSHGKLIGTETIFKGELEGRRVRSFMTSNGILIISESRFYLLGNKIYQFRSVQKENVYDSLDAGQLHFFEFARFVKNPGSNLQFSNVIPHKSNAEKLGYSVGYLSASILILFVVLFVAAGVTMTIIFVIRKRKEKN